MRIFFKLHLEQDGVHNLIDPFSANDKVVLTDTTEARVLYRTCCLVHQHEGVIWCILIY